MDPAKKKSRNKSGNHTLASNIEKMGANLSAVRCARLSGRQLRLPVLSVLYCLFMWIQNMIWFGDCVSDFASSSACYSVYEALVTDPSFLSFNI